MQPDLPPPAVAAAPAPAAARPAGVPEAGGLAAVRRELARRGWASVIAELTRPAGGEPSPEAVAAARAALARELRQAGVTEVRGLGSLPYVALEVDARQLETLLAGGRVAAVAPNGCVGVDRATPALAPRGAGPY